MDPKILDIAASIQSYVKIPEETDFLVREAEKAKHGIIEVGSWYGRSSVLLASVARDKKIPFVAIDTWESCDIEPGKDNFPTWRSNMLLAGFLWDKFSLAPDNGLYSAYTDTTEVYRGQCISVMRMPSRVASRLINHFRFDYDSVPRFDFLFIDADHEYESVKEDFHAWLPNLTRPATVVLHDVNCGHIGVKKFFDELKQAGYETEETGNIGLVRI